LGSFRRGQGRQFFVAFALIAIASGALLITFDDGVSDHSDGAFSGGTGTAADPFLLCTAADLKEVMTYTASSNTWKMQFVLG
jgi:hypothetical protein